MEAVLYFGFEMIDNNSPRGKKLAIDHATLYTAFASRIMAHMERPGPAVADGDLLPYTIVVGDFGGLAIALVETVHRNWSGAENLLISSDRLIEQRAWRDKLGALNMNCGLNLHRLGWHLITRGAE